MPVFAVAVPIIAGATKAVSIFSAIGKIGKVLFGGKKAIIPSAVAGGLGFGLAGVGDGKKRRRRRKRLTNTEIQELLILKQIVGPRSPLLTIAGLKMLSRGG